MPQVFYFVAFGAAQWARDCFLPRRHSLARGSSTASDSSSQSSWSSGVYPEATASAVDLHSARTTNNLSKLEIAAQARATSTISVANCSRWLCGRKPSQGNGTRSLSAKLKAPGARDAATRLAAKRSASCSRSTVLDLISVNGSPSRRVIVTGPSSAARNT